MDDFLAEFAQLTAADLSNRKTQTAMPVKIGISLIGIEKPDTNWSVKQKV